MSRWNQAPMDRNQTVLFYPTVDAAISQDHTVRLVEEVLASMDWSEWERHYCLWPGNRPFIRGSWPGLSFMD